MNIKSFLEKDMLVFLENIENYGTKETNKAVEEDTTSLFTSTIKPETTPTQVVPTQVNVTISQDQIKQATKPEVVVQKEIIKEIIPEPAPAPVVAPKISPEVNPDVVPSPKVLSPSASEPVIEKAPALPESVSSSQPIVEKKSNIGHISNRVSTPDFKPSSESVVAPKVSPEVNPDVVPSPKVLSPSASEPLIEKAPALVPKPIEKPEVSSPPELKTTDENPYSQGEIESQLDELNKYINAENVDATFELYTHLRRLGINITLDAKVENNLFHLLQETAKFLTEHKTKTNSEKTPDILADKGIVETKGQNSQEIKKESKLKTITEKPADIQFKTYFTTYMKDYLEGLDAIKKKDKLNALKILVPLSKEHPKNRAIKLRIKEALEL